MKSFIELTGIAVPMPWPNMDTGLLAHSQYCRDHPNDLRGGLFRDWRFDANGNENKDFILDRPRYSGAQIIVAGPNFGCGSSRETAVWALAQSGFRAVIASSFGDIFRDNAFQNGLLTVILDQVEIERIQSALDATKQPTMRVDLVGQRIAPPGLSEIHFEIEPDRRTAMLEGLDETMLVRRSNDKIEAFEIRDQELRPWIYESRHRAIAGR